MIRLALLLLLVAAVDGPGEHTLWDDEDAAHEAALEESQSVDNPADEDDPEEPSED